MHAWACQPQPGAAGRRRTAGQEADASEGVAALWGHAAQRDVGVELQRAQYLRGRARSRAGGQSDSGCLVRHVGGRRRRVRGWGGGAERLGQPA